jgi:hypothetical protein
MTAPSVSLSYVLDPLTISLLTLLGSIGMLACLLGTRRRISALERLTQAESAIRATADGECAPEAIQDDLVRRHVIGRGPTQPRASRAESC